MRVMIVDDEDLVRSGLKSWLATLGDVEIVGEAGNAEECLGLLAEAAPDVLLIDILLPGVSGIELVRQVVSSNSEVRCLVFSGSSSSDLVLDSFSAGASGYLPKDTSTDELRIALGYVANGLWYLSPAAGESVISAAIEMRNSLRQADADEASGLSDRERELLKLISEGHTFAEIARRFGVNPRSVERMKVKLQHKLEAETLADLIKAAVKRGIIAA